MENFENIANGSRPQGLAAAYDVLVVGGGINGAGIARDLAGRGLSVLLCEKDDLAAHTSSASTKLIHGGLRYLEYYEFGLVRKALAEREVLLKSAPHIMRPLRFVMPHEASMRPAWMIRLGLFLYDHLARREVLPGSQGLDLRRHPAGQPLKARYTRGFVYSDGWVDDARLVVLNAVDAAARGATIRTYTACVELRADGARWRARLQGRDGETSTVHAGAVVNAAGPWADRFLRGQAGRGNVRNLRLVKGSHIVVPRLFQHDHAYILQNADGRIIFAIPYEGQFTLIGTTDVEHGESLDQVRIGDDEIRYLCEQASHYFRQPVRAADVLWTYSGVRPLLDDEAGNAAAVTRDYRLELHRDGPPLLTVWGGKITTYRKLAEEAAGVVADALGRPGRPWTARAHLPGGDLSAFIGAPQAPDVDFARFLGVLEQSHGWLPAAMRYRMARAYGARMIDLLGEARCLADLGEMLAPGVCVRELDYLRQTEWARTGDDVLWRRSKLGLHLNAEQRAAIDSWMASRPDSFTHALPAASESVA